jgi:hypothetical protein
MAAAFAHDRETCLIPGAVRAALGAKYDSRTAPQHDI